ncbi:MAG TPA: hypothetical protein VHV78_06880, partial [Gemmatimonadaceae bacterium]|nr:hypothetical protein [Gemmatimonadaceae bacterium]
RVPAAVRSVVRQSEAAPTSVIDRVPSRSAAYAAGDALSHVGHCGDRSTTHNNRPCGSDGNG